MPYKWSISENTPIIGGGPLIRPTSINYGRAHYQRGKPKPARYYAEYIYHDLGFDSISPLSLWAAQRSALSLSRRRAVGALPLPRGSALSLPLVPLLGTLSLPPALFLGSAAALSLSNSRRQRWERNRSYLSIPSLLTSLYEGRQQLLASIGVRWASDQSLLLLLAHIWYWCC